MTIIKKLIFLFFLTICISTINGQQTREEILKSTQDYLDTPLTPIRTSQPVLTTSADHSKNEIASTTIATKDDVVIPMDEAGATAGSLSVNLQGGVNYTIPVTTPSGIKDILPNIGITYNSQTANGLAGWGWNISGVSTITRIPSTKYHDGFIDPVDLDSSDRYALDGQRLLLKSGTYGDANSEYQTEKFSNLKIKAFGSHLHSPSYFIVYYPNGSRAWYGNSGNSRSDLEWSIYKFEDPQGNFMEYSYKLSDGILRVNTIKYGSTIGTTSPNLIDFIYKDRSHAEISYISGKQFKRTHILDKIQVTANGSLFRTYLLKHRTSAINYQLLTSIKEYNGASKEFNAIAFNYKTESIAGSTLSNNLAPIFEEPVALSPGAKYDTHNTLIGDFNADGRTDFITYEKNGNGNINLYSGFFPSYNGSSPVNLGRSFNLGSFDAIFGSTFMIHNIKENKYRVFPGQAFTVVSEDFSMNGATSNVQFKSHQLGTLGLLGYEKVWEAPTYVYYKDGTANSYNTSTNIGSGTKTISKDFITAEHRIYNTANVTYKVSQELTLKPGFHVTYGAEFTGKINTNNRRKIPKQYVTGDFNGDGITDVLAIQKSYATSENCFDRRRACIPSGIINDPKVYFIDLNRSKTSNFSNLAGTLQDNLNPEYPITSGDFDGDGKSDLFQFTDGKMKVYTLNANNQLILLTTLSNDSIKKNTPTLFGDYNGDGKTDFVLPTAKDSEVWNFFIATGNSFFHYSKDFNLEYKVGYGTNNTAVIESGIAAPYVEYHYIAQDFNSDGKTDLIRHKVVTPYADNSRSVDYITYSSNIGTDTTGKVKFWNRNYFKRNQGNIKNGIPIFLDTNTNGGNLEYGYLGVNNFYAYKFNLDHKKDTQLHQINNNGLVQDIYYESLDENDIYGAYKSSYEDSFPYRNINLATNFKLVSKITETVAGIKRAQHYKYQGATSHLEGLGFLGFRTIKTTNWDGDGVTKIWNISQRNPLLRGAVERSWTSTNSYSYGGEPSTYITKSDYTYNSTIGNNKVVNIKPKRIVMDDDLHGVTTTKSFTYDPYNNPLTTSTTVLGGSSTETYTYANNPGGTNQNYHIGRLKTHETSTTQYGNTFSTKKEYSYTDNLVDEIKTKGNATDWLTESLEYDNFGNITSKTVLGSGVTSRTEYFEYDTSGRFLTKSTDIQGLENTFTYDTFGNVLTMTNPYNQTTTYSYDGWDRVTEETNYLNKTTTTKYTSESGDYFMAIHTDYPDGSKEKRYINRLGWEVKTSTLQLNDKWVSQSIEYDIVGRAIRQSEPYFAAPSQWNVNAYDAYGRPISNQLYTGKTISSSYEGLSITANDGTKTVTSTRDAMGNVKEVNDPGGTIAYTYYGNGAIKSSNYEGHKIDFTIDGWGRKTRIYDPSAGTYTYTYNILGELLEQTTPIGTTSLTYDDYGKVIQKKIEGQNTALQLNYAYNTTTKLLTGISAADNFFNKSYNYTYEYDSYIRPVKITEQTDTAQFENSYSYDSYGRVYQNELFSATGGQESSVTTRNIYDAVGIRSEVIDANTGSSLWKLVDENQRGQALSIELGNGITKTKAYDSYGLAKELKDTHGTTAIVAMHMEYTFDAVRGLLEDRTNHSFDTQENFAYDSLDRLTGISGAVSKTQAYDTRGRITNNSTIGMYTYQNSSTYQLKDISLNTTGKNYYEKHSPQEITYNAFKKPVDVYEADNGRVSFEYGPMMNRSHAWYGGLEEDKQERRYHKQYSTIAPIEIVHDTENNSYKTITYVMGGAYSAPIAHIKKTGSHPINEYHYLHRDYQGSILAISDSDGAMVEKRQFGAWGTVDKFWSASGANSFGYDSILGRGYTGHEHFSSVGLIHMNGRMYDAKLGRFLSPDNFIQDPYNTQNYNRYGYVLNNPLKYNDPSGELMTDPYDFARNTNTGIEANPGLSNTQQTLLGNLVATVAQNWDDWRIGDFLGTNIESAVNDIGDFFESVGDLFSAVFGGNKDSGPTTITIPSNSISMNSSMGTGAGIPPILSSNGMNGGGISAGDLARTTADFVPFVGSGLDVYEGFRDGNAWQAAAGIGFFALDIATLGSSAINAARGSTKLLNQFNSAESLISGAGKLNKVKAGMQGFVKGDGASIFKSISQGGTRQTNGTILMNDGTTLFNHFSTKTGAYTIDINRAGQVFKIRIAP